FVDRLDQLVDDMLRRRHVGIAHAEINDIGATRARRRLQTVHFREYVGRQALDAVKAFAHKSLPSAPQPVGVIVASSCARNRTHGRPGRYSQPGERPVYACLPWSVQYRGAACRETALTACDKRGFAPRKRNAAPGFGPLSPYF